MIRSLAFPLALLTFVQLAGCAHAPGVAPTSPSSRSQSGSSQSSKDPPDAPASAHVLLYKVDVVVDDGGRITRTLHRRYRIDDPSAADQGWGSTASEWSVWRDEKPVLHTIVEAPDGSRRELDPATIEDASASDGDPAVYSDHRVVRAPLPAIEAGAIVDETIVTRAKTTTAPRTVGSLEVLGDPVGADDLQISIDVPDSLPLAWKLEGDDGPVREEHAGGRHRVSVSRKAFRREDHREAFAPDDVAAVPYLRFAAGTGWRELAAHYAKLVDSALASTHLEAKARAAVASTDDLPTKVRKLTDLVKREVRYVGLEFGSSAIVPHSPTETLQHRYGDCKDQATLLVGLLRGVGVDASVALLDVSGSDADAALPSLDAFDHAIVYVAGPQPIWVDTTDSQVPARVLPASDQGRLALVASSSTRGLVRTPESKAAENVYRERREVWLAEEGSARLVETDEVTGLAEHDLREQFSSPATIKRDAAEDYVKRVYGAEQLGAYKAGDPADLSKPFTLTYEALRTKRGATNDEIAEFIIEDKSAFAFIPASVLDDDRTVGAKLGYAHRSELEVLVHAPDGYEATATPPNDELRLGPGRLTRSFERADARTLRARVTFELPSRVLSAEELRALREGIEEHSKKDSLRLRFASHAATLEAQGRSPEALQLLRAAAEAAGSSFVAGRRYASLLLRLGFVAEAQRIASRLAAANPDDETLASFDASLRLHDSVGRVTGGDVSYSSGIAYVKKILPRMPKVSSLNMMLAESELVNSSGWFTMKKENIVRARAALEAWERVAEADAVKADVHLPLALLRLGDVPAARAVAARRSDETKQRVLLVCAAMTGGADAAKRELDELGVQAKERATLLDGASATAVETRQYAAAVVLRQLQSDLGAPNETQLKVVQALRKGSAGEPPDVAAAHAFFVNLTFLAAEGRFADGRTGASDVEMTLAHSLGPAASWVSSLLAHAPVEVVQDIATALFVGTRGRTFGDLTEVQLSPFQAGAAVHVLVANDGGKYRVLATEDLPPPLIGKVASEELDHGKETRARGILDWYFGQREGDSSIPTATAGLFVWRQTGDVRLAIAAMRAGDSPSAAASLSAAPSNPADRDLRVALDTARMFVAADAGSDDGASALAKLKQDGASSASVRPLAIGWRARRGEVAEIDRLVAEPNIPASARSAAYVQAAFRFAHLGKLAEAYALFLKAEGISSLSAESANEAAWVGLLAGRGGDRVTLDLARRGANGEGAAELNTLASIEAAYGDVPAALATIAKWKTAFGRRPLRASDALPFALLAERHGLIDEAIRLLEPIARETSPTGGGAFARQKLEALRKTSPKG